MSKNGSVIEELNKNKKSESKNDHQEANIYNMNHCKKCL
jgi:hypothetical protein